MKISARNQLKGTIKDIQEGAVNGVVTICLGGNKVKADITMEAIKDLGLSEGKEAYAIIKASSVMFATDEIKGSITNEAIEQLGFKEGGEAVAIIKATEVMVGVE